ncbi:MAG TPA: hypothetical protein VHC70_15545 [Phycisphaerales bacterium]|jgi:hypothetical protein|nr:hypothetical protein [Phycisphaerales bacterium]
MIGCLFGLVAFFTPRIAIVLLWLFTGGWLESCFAKLSPPFNGCFVPVLGLLFAPYTLLAYCLAWHQNGGVISGMWIVLIVLAALMDLGVIGHGSRSRRRWRKNNDG